MEYKILHKNARKHIDNPGIISDARIIEIVENSRLFIEDIESKFWKESARIEIVFQYGKSTMGNYRWYGMCCPTRYVTRKELTHTLYIFIKAKSKDNYVWERRKRRYRNDEGNIEIEFYRQRVNRPKYEIDYSADKKRVEHTLGHELGHIYYPPANREYRLKGTYYKECEQNADDFANLVTENENE